jgi:hypothetical protein
VAAAPCFFFVRTSKRASEQQQALLQLHAHLEVADGTQALFEQLQKLGFFFR